MLAAPRRRRTNSPLLLGVVHNAGKQTATVATAYIPSQTLPGDHTYTNQTFGIQHGSLNLAKVLLQEVDNSQSTLLEKVPHMWNRYLVRQGPTEAPSAPSVMTESGVWLFANAMPSNLQLQHK